MATEVKIISNQELAKYIFDKPEYVVKLLNRHGYKTSNRVTLNEITTKTFQAIYNEDKAFTDDLTSMIASEHANWVAMVVTAVLSLASTIIGSAQAKKQRELQRNLAIAQLEQDRLLAQEEIRVYGETERTKILANSLLEYRTALQQEATKREKNVFIYLLAVGLSIALIYGTVILLEESK